MLLDLPHTDHGPRDGLPVILLHGFPFDHTMWAAQERALAAAGFRTLAPDLRGLGKGPMGGGPGRIEDFAGDVLRLADRAGLRRFALVGFSLGGYVAVEACRQLMQASTGRAPHDEEGRGRGAVARQAPERLAGLALVDSRAEADGDEARKGRAALAERVRAQGAQALVDAMLPKMLVDKAREDDVRAMMLRTRSEGAVHALEAIAARPASFDVLRALKVPVLVVVGKDDPVTPPDAARAMVAEAPGARLVVVPGAHLTPMESPEEVTAALLEWARALAA